MKRGDLVSTTGLNGYGKPRPALIIQSDLFQKHPSMTVLLVTSDLREAPLFRIEVKPTPENGLKKLSQIMIDKTVTVPVEKLGAVFGRLDEPKMLAVNRALAVWFGFA
jgi:mRNA interferase MazF